MSFLLKIVEGPNKGAEIALVSGIAVTFGKSDDCDIVLADATFPSDPVSIEASEDGVTVDSEPLEQLAVKTLGATSFAVGPADAPWGELKWPEKVEIQKPKAESSEEERGEGSGAEDKKRKKEDGSHASSGASEDGATQPADGKKKKKHGGCCGCLVALMLLAFAVAALAWFYRAAIKDFCDSKGYDIHSISNIIDIHSISNIISVVASSDKSEKPSLVEKVTLASVAARYGLQVESTAGSPRLSGNLKTRGERLRATAEAYEAQPGVELDISDDESFRTAAEDALFTLTEGALKVVSATNRVLAISGISRSPGELEHMLRTLGADLPKLRKVDTEGVVFGRVPRRVTRYGGRDEMPSDAPIVTRQASKKATTPTLPVCGILTKPYPCLVMRDGTRIMEGASIGGNMILKIEADAVTVTNSTGRFTWKP